MPAGEKRPYCFGPAGQAGFGGLPVTGDDLRDRKAFFGIVDARLEELFERQAAEAPAQLIPAVNAAGDRPAQGTGFRNLLEPLAGKPLAGGLVGRAAASVETVQL